MGVRDELYVAKSTISLKFKLIHEQNYLFNFFSSINRKIFTK